MGANESFPHPALRGELLMVVFTAVAEACKNLGGAVDRDAVRSNSFLRDDAWFQQIGIERRSDRARLVGESLNLFNEMRLTEPRQSDDMVVLSNRGEIWYRLWQRHENDARAEFAQYVQELSFAKAGSTFDELHAAFPEVDVARIEAASSLLKAFSVADSEPIVTDAPEIPDAEAPQEMHDSAEAGMRITSPENVSPTDGIELVDQDESASSLDAASIPTADESPVDEPFLELQDVSPDERPSHFREVKNTLYDPVDEAVSEYSSQSEIDPKDDAYAQDSGVDEPLPTNASVPDADSSISDEPVSLSEPEAYMPPRDEPVEPKLFALPPLRRSPPAEEPPVEDGRRVHATQRFEPPASDPEPLTNGERTQQPEPPSPPHSSRLGGFSLRGSSSSSFDPRDTSEQPIPDLATSPLKARRKFRGNDSGGGLMEKHLSNMPPAEEEAAAPSKPEITPPPQNRPAVPPPAQTQARPSAPSSTGGIADKNTERVGPRSGKARMPDGAPPPAASQAPSAAGAQEKPAFGRQVQRTEYPPAQEKPDVSPLERHRWMNNLEEPSPTARRERGPSDLRRRGPRESNAPQNPPREAPGQSYQELNNVITRFTYPDGRMVEITQRMLDEHRAEYGGSFEDAILALHDLFRLHTDNDG